MKRNFRFKEAEYEARLANRGVNTDTASFRFAMITSGIRSATAYTANTCGEPHANSSRRSTQFTRMFTPSQTELLNPYWRLPLLHRPIRADAGAGAPLLPDVLCCEHRKGRHDQPGL